MRKAGIVLVVLLAATAFAAKPVGGGFGCFGPLVAFTDFQGLNDAFGAAGIPHKLNSTHWAFGGAGYGLVERIVIGGSGWGGSQTIASDSLSAEVSVSGGAFNIGYQVLSTKHLIVAPVLGVGGGGYSITLRKLSGSVPNFGELLLDPGRTSTVSFSGLQLSPELMIVIPVNFTGLQIRGGAVYSPMSADWTLEDGGKLNQGPQVSKLMPYVSASIVFGGFGRGGRTRAKVKVRHDDEDRD
jgi:hypothetical protein